MIKSKIQRLIERKTQNPQNLDNTESDEGARLFALIVDIAQVVKITPKELAKQFDQDERRKWFVEELLRERMNNIEERAKAVFCKSAIKKVSKARKLFNKELEKEADDVNKGK